MTHDTRAIGSAGGQSPVVTMPARHAPAGPHDQQCRRPFRRTAAMLPTADPFGGRRGWRSGTVVFAGRGRLHRYGVDRAQHSTQQQQGNKDTLGHPVLLHAAPRTRAKNANRKLLLLASTIADAAPRVPGTPRHARRGDRDGNAAPAMSTAPSGPGTKQTRRLRDAGAPVVVAGEGPPLTTGCGTSRCGSACSFRPPCGRSWVAGLRPSRPGALCPMQATRLFRPQALRPPMLSLILLCLLLSLAGCGGPSRPPPSFAPRVEPGRTSFLTRVHNDCLAGHQWACDMLNDLARGLREKEGR